MIRPDIRLRAEDGMQKTVLGTFHGDADFPIEWRDGERDLFWVLDDLHCPNPLSPMFFDIGGWWLTCDHMFRRFGTPFASDWVAKEINGYLYTAAIPADADLRAEAAEYNARYVPRVPDDAAYAGRIGGYLGSVLPHYATSFMDWWRDRLRPEIERNFAYLDGFDMEGADLVALAVLLEEAIDVHDRHWKIHWMINFSQFSATMALNGAIGELGAADASLPGRLQSSVADRNWDSIEALWQMKEEIKGDSDLKAAFAADTAAGVLAALAASARGSEFLEQRLDPYRSEFGRKAVWSHEFVFPTWFENPAPIVEALRGYLETDYDYPATLAAVRADLDGAIAELLAAAPEGAAREGLRATLELSLGLNPLTPDHHFYIDQGTNARLRLVLIAIGRKLAAAGVIDDAEDVVYLRYNELRAVIGDASSLDARTLIGERRDAREAAFEIRPPDWVGTATEDALAFPYLTLWGFPEKFHRPRSVSRDQIAGLGASAGIAEGPARVVESLAEFDQVQAGDILVCRMTNPAWVVLFTKIGGLVTDAGGMAAHPAVVAREFALPAVVGTSNATQRITTGQRVRVNGATGIVDVLE
jgi:phosphohistidine swiveling domain-containing protein